ncbi:unnamed protein product [Urochloa decumbens]|uniref:F-box domain-containing protein n=1 Tax=Urochloa decumbens TaxID=240449 RepID=A0ABC8VHR4_9POAL
MASSPAARRIAGARAAQPNLPDEILEDIFIRLDSTADLARACAVCTTFRRVVSARPFLRRYRSLHAPPVLGGILAEYGEFYPADSPHRSARAAAAVARAAGFTFSFLPKRNRWRTRDVRDGRVLLSAYASASSLEDLVVRDPLHRRYVLIPSIPSDQMPSRRHFGDKQDFEPFLAPASEEEKESSSFRAICNMLSENKVVTFVFSSITGQLQKVTEIRGFLSIRPELFMRHYAGKCFYWTHPYRSKLLMLDMVRMKFSLVNLPPDPPGRPWRCGMMYAIVEFEGRLGFLALDNGMLELYLRDDGVDADEWRHGARRSPCLSIALSGSSLVQMRATCSYEQALPRRCQNHNISRCI